MKNGMKNALLKRHFKGHLQKDNLIHLKNGGKKTALKTGI